MPDTQESEPLLLTIQTGEMIAVRLKGGLVVGRCAAPPDRGPDPRVKLATGRGRERTLPLHRVAATTGVVAPGQAEADSFAVLFIRNSGFLRVYSELTLNMMRHYTPSN